MYRDASNLELHAPSEAAVEAFEEAIDSFLHFRKGILDPVHPYLSGEGFFPLGEAFGAYLAGLSTEAGVVARANARFTQFSRRAERYPLTVRERRHLDAAGLLLAGDLTGAARGLAGISRAYPHDILALATGHQVDYLLGSSASLRDRIGAALPCWREEDPRYPSLLGMYAFGLEESGHWHYAEDLGTKAVELDPAGVWAIHAVAHSHEMRGRFGEGIEWLDAQRGSWDTENFMRGHVSWHYCLYLLEIGLVDDVLRRYDTEIAPGKTDQKALEFVNGSSLLWRLYLAGIDVSERFTKLARLWHPVVRRAWSAFNDIHAVMCYVGSGAVAQAQALVRDREKYVAEAPSTIDNVRVTAEIGLPVCRAVLAFGRAAHGEVLDLLYPIRCEFYRCGGSNAQRDVIQQTLVESAIRAGRLDEARALVGERIAIRPDGPLNWLKDSRVAAAAGDDDRADRSRRRAGDLVLTSKLNAGFAVH